MTPRSDLALLAAKALSTAPGEKRHPSASDEARAVALMAAAIRARRQRSVWLRRTIGGVAAAAAIVLAVGVAKRRVDQPPSSSTAKPEVGASASAGAMVG